MKKKFILVILLTLFIVTGCDKKEKLSCKTSVTDTGSSNNLNITFNFVNDKISSVYEEGTITFDETYVKYINSYKESLEETYKNKGFDYSATISNNNINFKLVSDSKSNSKLLKILNIKEKTKEKVKKTMEERGYSCK